MKEKCIYALKRAGWTAAETALAMIPVGAAIYEINWVQILAVVATAALISFLKSIVVNMPEVTMSNELQNLQSSENEIVVGTEAADGAQSTSEEGETTV